MKVIFLDNDGVICLASNFGVNTKKWEAWVKTNPETLNEKDAPVDVRFNNFDKQSIEVLNQILVETDAEIVVSSDWKKHATLDELGDYYIAQGIIKRPIGMTKLITDCVIPEGFPFHRAIKYEQDRSIEINQYLIDNPQIKHWVAVDDLTLGININMSDGSSKWGLSNFVRCVSLNEGIKKNGVKEKIIEFLK